MGPSKNETLFTLTGTRTVEEMFNEYRSDRKDGVIDVYWKDRDGKTLLMNYLEHG